VSNVVVLDENPEGLEGPWVTYARMVTLRTNKALTGDIGGGAVGGSAAGGGAAPDGMPCTRHHML